MAKEVKKEKNDSFYNDENNIKCGEIMFANNTRFCFSCTFCQKYCDKLQDFFRHVLFDHLNYLDEYEFDDEEVIKHIETDEMDEISNLTKKNNSFGYNFDKFISKRIADAAVSIKSEEDDIDEDEGNYKDDIEEIELFEEANLPAPEKKRSSRSSFNDMHIEFLEEPSENEYEPESTEFAEAYSIKNDSQDEQDPDADEDIVEIELNNISTQYSNESEDEENRPSPKTKKVIHTKGNDFKCAFPDCKRSFLTKSGAKRHFQNVHNPTNKGITCETCFKTFSTQSMYEKHNMLRHLGVRPHACEICGQSFSDKSNLKVHIMRHKGIKPHECSICQKRFHSSTELKLHMRTHTGERPFVCEVCGRKFSNSGHLCNHRRRHFGERPYECNVCQKKFFDRKLLNDHAIMHTTERPFECATCSATFQRKKALLQHEKLHSGTKQYVCKLCGKSFAQNAGLYSHMKSH